MKRYAHWFVAAAAVLWLAATLIPPREQEFQSREFGRIPVLLNGRVQPLDSVARNALLQIRTKQTVPITDSATGASATLAAIDWLKEALFHADLADSRAIFRIDHPEVLALLNIRREDKYYSFAEVRPALGKVEQEARRIHESQRKPEQLTPYEKAINNLYNRLILFQRIKNSVKPERVNRLTEQFTSFQQSIAPGRAAAQAQRSGQPFDQAALDAFLAHLSQFEMVSRFAYPLIVPGVTPGHQREDWSNAGNALMDAAKVESGTVPEPLFFYARMHDAYREGNSPGFNEAVAGYHGWLINHDYAREVRKGRHEHFYNRLQAFYRSMVLYVGAFLLAAVSWFNLNQFLRRSALALSIVAIVLHTAGLIFRMVLEGRPPVTNLYSSAIFIGWGTVILGIIIERFYRDGIGTVVGTFTGFVSLVVAHNLSLSGDTMEMLRAVLDTNFWLATHVVIITIGYSATFVAGFLGLLYILRGFFTSTLTADRARSLARMVYGVTCFAILFSFTGTVLGGIWADQSWGRFWGWDPKENGALMIVIWNAFYLHARWGKILSEKALMATAVFGNVITAFSWFGTNMLGIGLHSYGFMDAAFKWLIFFDVTQMLFIGLALLPLRYWRSRHHLESSPPSGTPSTPSHAPMGSRPKPATA